MCASVFTHHRRNLAVDEVEDDEGHRGVPGEQIPQMVLSVDAANEACHYTHGCEQETPNAPKILPCGTSSAKRISIRALEQCSLANAVQIQMTIQLKNAAGSAEKLTVRQQKEILHSDDWNTSGALRKPY